MVQVAALDDEGTIAGNNYQLLGRCVSPACGSSLTLSCFVSTCSEIPFRATNGEHKEEFPFPKPHDILV